jgi:hypothetical protein
MPPATVGVGQAARVNLANVRVTQPGDTASSCDVVTTFFDESGASLGLGVLNGLGGEASATVAAPSHIGLLRAVVTIANPGVAQRACAVRSVLEVFDVNTRSTVFAVPSMFCLGASECSSLKN